MSRSQGRNNPNTILQKTNPKKKKKVKPCCFYPFNVLLNTKDFTHLSLIHI